MPNTAGVASPVHEALYKVARQWFHNPDTLAIRAVLACAGALDMTVPRLWILIVGPPSSAKTDLYVRLGTVYFPCIQTDDISAAGLISMEKETQGKGALKRLEPKGLWAINDFSSIQSLREETRATITAAMRRIYDGRWDRTLRGTVYSYIGHCNVLAAATNSIERFHRLQADLGDRFMYVRTARYSGSEVGEKARAQLGRRPEMEAHLRYDAEQVLLNAKGPQAKLIGEMAERLERLTELCAQARTPISYDFKGEIDGIGNTESAGRLYNQLSALAIADATLHGQPEVTDHQLPLLRRVVLDTAPEKRSIVLHLFAHDTPPIAWADLWRISGIKWQSAFDRAVTELALIGLLDKKQVNEELFIEPSKMCRELLRAASY